MYKYMILISFFLLGCGKEGPFKGDKGNPGSNGSQGAQGQAATPVYAIQLCPNQPQPQYPNHFPEMAICINNSLYAVYNGTIDYLTALPSGNYISIAPEGCNLIIQENCKVIQQ